MTDDLRKLAEEVRNFRIGNMGNYSIQAVQLLNLQGQWNAAANPAKIIELLDTIKTQRVLLEMALEALDPSDERRYLGMAGFRSETVAAITNHLRQQEGEKG